MKFNVKGIFKFVDKALRNIKWTCNYCGREVFNDSYFCPDCLNALPFNDGNTCSHCGRSVIKKEDYCLSCKNFLVSVDRARSVFRYEGSIKRLIPRFKYHDEKHLGEVFAHYLANCYFENYFNSDLTLFVPMDKETLKERGYNQTEVLANNLSEIINVPVKADVLIKKKPTNHAGLSRKDRLKSMDAYKVVKRKEVKDKSILLIDDVMTTGATVEAIAKLLKKAGAREVNVLTVASIAF